MKKSYITYRILSGKIILALDHKGFFSGTISKEPIPGSKELGYLDIYEGRDNPEPVEKVIFCSFDKELHSHGTRERGATFFNLNQRMPVGEMDSIQRRVIPFIIEEIPFRGSLYFVDKRRGKTYQEFIDPPYPHA